MYFGATTMPLANAQPTMASSDDIRATFLDYFATTGTRWLKARRWCRATIEAPKLTKAVASGRLRLGKPKAR
jgi:hypothetical protein